MHSSVSRRRRVHPVLTCIRTKNSPFLARCIFFHNSTKAGNLTNQRKNFAPAPACWPFLCAWRAQPLAFLLLLPPPLPCSPCTMHVALKEMKRKKKKIWCYITYPRHSFARHGRMWVRVTVIFAVHQTVRLRWSILTADLYPYGNVCVYVRP